MNKIDFNEKLNYKISWVNAEVDDFADITNIRKENDLIYLSFKRTLPSDRYEYTGVIRLKLTTEPQVTSKDSFLTYNDTINKLDEEKVFYEVKGKFIDFDVFEGIWLEDGKEYQFTLTS